jgi:hypothetical protein
MAELNLGSRPSIVWVVLLIVFGFWLANQGPYPFSAITRFRFETLRMITVS